MAESDRVHPVARSEGNGFQALGFAHIRARSALEQIAEEDEVQERFPRTAHILALVAETLFEHAERIEERIMGRDTDGAGDQELDEELEGSLEALVRQVKSDLGDEANEEDSENE